jgi:hypothetical protein
MSASGQAVKESGQSRVRVLAGLADDLDPCHDNIRTKLWERHGREKLGIRLLRKNKKSFVPRFKLNVILCSLLMEECSLAAKDEVGAGGRRLE